MYIHVYTCICMHIHVYTRISTHKPLKFVPKLFKTFVFSSQTIKIELPKPNIDKKDALDWILPVPGPESGARNQKNWIYMCTHAARAYT